MADFTALKMAITNAIKQNGNQAITGNLLQEILIAMVESLGDTALNNLATSIQASLNSLSAEDGNLANAISSEASTRQTADDSLESAINSEALARSQADTTLQQNINTESNQRQSTDNSLQNQITVEKNARIDAVNRLQGLIDAINNVVGNGYTFGGVVKINDAPQQGKMFYIALERGNYINFGGASVHNGITLIYNNGQWIAKELLDLDVFYGEILRIVNAYQPIVIEGNVTNAPDEEDLTSNNIGLLQFKNKAYAPTIYSGLGRKYLRKNIRPRTDSASFDGFVENVESEASLSGTPDAIFWDRINERFVGKKDDVYYQDWTDSGDYVPVSSELVYMNEGTPYRWDGTDLIVYDEIYPDLINMLTQEMISDANTIYHIQYDFTLGANITVPSNCILEFDGGSISGAHTLTGNNTGIQAGLVKIFSTDVTLVGTWNVAEAYPEWFGAKGDGVTDDYLALKKCLYGFKILNLVKDNRYKIINPNELDAAFYLYSNYKINGNNATIAFGYTDNFCPLFVTVLNSSNIVVKNLQIDWVGDIENFTVKEYINDSNCIFALRGTKKSLFSNIKCSSSVDKPYVAFAKALGGTFENTIFEDIILSHYNFGFVQGIHYMTIRNVKGTKRSNVVDNPDKAYNVGPSHLVYLAGDGVVLTDVTEEGDLLDESRYGFSGATVQVQAGENIVIQNIVTKMKNTGALNLKKLGSHKNNIIENVVCNCSNWDFDTFSEEWAPVTIVTYQDDNSYGLIINNVTVNIANKPIKAVRLAGNHITVSNCVITASGNQDNTVLDLATLYNSRIDVKIFNSDAYKQGIVVSNIIDNRVDIYSNCDIIADLDEGRGANRNNLFASNNDRMIQLVGTIRDNTVVYPKRTWEIADAPASATNYTKNFLFAGTTGAYLIYFSYGAFNHINTDVLIMNLDISGSSRTCDMRHISHLQRYQGFTYNREIVVNSIGSQGCNMTINVSGNRTIDYINFKIMKL